MVNSEKSMDSASTVSLNVRETTPLFKLKENDTSSGEVSSPMNVVAIKGIINRSSIGLPAASDTAPLW